MTAATDPGPRLVIIGGGVTGLAAAWEASRRGVSVTVLEASTRFGGKVRTSALDLPTGPLVVDEGADNFLARVPDAVELCVELGLGDQLTQPAVGRAAVWSAGALRPYPARHVLGVPLDVDDLAATGMVSDAALQRVAEEPERFAGTDAPGADVSIGTHLRDRLGDEVVDHVVGPLVGGINAGDIDELSLRAVTPQLAAAVADGGSLIDALRRRVDGAPTQGPVFRALIGGTETLVDELVDQLRARGAELRTDTTVTAIRPTARGRRSDDGSESGSGQVPCVVALADGTTIDADAVVLAVPAPVGAEVLVEASPRTAAELRRIVHVPVAFTTFALPRHLVALPDDLSGVLVPRDAGRLMTAVSFGSNKWPQWDDGTHVILRVAAGHRHDDRPSSLDDDELITALQAEMSEVLGISATPVAARVTRWSPGFAQYAVGHLELLERTRSALDDDLPAVRLAGADLGGLGIPACIAQGRTAVRDLLA